MTERLFKVLNEDGSCHHGGIGKWSLPTKSDDGSWAPGDWMPTIKGELVPCENGYHLCRESDLVHWLGPAIFEAEYRGERVDDDDKIVVREARLLCKLKAWNERTQRLFACDCAERVVHLVDDGRAQNAIDVARRYANGQATDTELAAARSAARSAAWDAASTAALGAAWHAARAAAWDECKWQTERLMEYLTDEHD